MALLGSGAFRLGHRSFAPAQDNKLDRPSPGRTFDNGKRKAEGVRRIFLVMPDMCYRETIWVVIRMDPRYRPAGMTVSFVGRVRSSGGRNPTGRVGKCLKESADRIVDSQT